MRGWFLFPGLPLGLGAVLVALLVLPWEHGDIERNWGQHINRPGKAGDVAKLPQGVLRTTMRFRSTHSPETLEGWLYLPPRTHQGQEAGKPPVVIMGPGLGSEKCQGLEVMAQEFALNGMAVFLFDYRWWGGSSGTPRQLLSLPRQQEDYEDAIKHIKTSDQVAPLVDSTRLAMWGFDTSGGHALVTAGRSDDSSLKAVVALSPYLESEPLYKAMFLGRGRVWATRFLSAVAADVLRGAIGIEQPLYVPLIGHARSMAAVPVHRIENEARPFSGPMAAGDIRTLACEDTIPICAEWQRKGDCETNPSIMVGDKRNTGFCRKTCGACTSEDPEPPHPGAWRNLVPARFYFTSRAYRPATFLSSINCSVLLIAARFDHLTPPRHVRAAAAALVPGLVTLVEWEEAHYGSFRKSMTPEGLAVTTDFLRKRLGVKTVAQPLGRRSAPSQSATNLKYDVDPSADDLVRLMEGDDEQEVNGNNREEL